MHNSQGPIHRWVYAPPHPTTCWGEISIINFLLLHLLVCVFIKAIVGHGKQLLPHEEKLSSDMTFGNGDIFLLMSFSSFSLQPLSNYGCSGHGQPNRQEALFAAERKQKQKQALPCCSAVFVETVALCSLCSRPQVLTSQVRGRSPVHVILMMGKSAFHSPERPATWNRGSGTSGCPQV